MIVLIELEKGYNSYSKARPKHSQQFCVKHHQGKEEIWDVCKSTKSRPFSQTERP